jgi:ATP-dependent DNA helicase RecQ
MLSSRLNRHDTIAAFDNLIYGHYKFLYLSPEKLESPFIQEKIAQLPLNLIAVDEAHCISQWGHDFRPAYLKIPVLNELHPDVPKIALTATATNAVAEDIIKHLGLRNVQLFKNSYYRENLHIRIQKRENIRGRMLRLVQAVDEPVIVYVGTRKDTIGYRQFLLANQVNATIYHGGMTPVEKSESLDLWTSETCKVMVATNAFGMGIDKSNVRMIIHAHLPRSIENYIQEIGRAGRDGKIAATYLLYNENTIADARTLLNNSLVSPEFCKNVYGRLNDSYQIAMGELSEELFNFNLNEFSLQYDLNPGAVFQALLHFQSEGVIMLDERSIRSSQVKIVENSKMLYDLQSSPNTKGKVLQLLLRNFGGIHEQFTPISEMLLARKAGLTKEVVCDTLSSLDRDKVLHYRKFSEGMHLRFLVPREDNFVFQTIKNNIHSKNRVRKVKLKDMLSLVASRDECRQVYLLRYFGEVLQIPCGHCDNCISKNKKKVSPDRKSQADSIIDILSISDQMDIREIVSALGTEEDSVVKTLEIMVENGTIDLNLQNKFYLKR